MYKNTLCRFWLLGAIFFFVLSCTQAADAAELRGYYTRFTPDRDLVMTYEDLLSGEFADLVVQFEDGGRVVFRRTSSYLPYWEAGPERWYFDEIVG